MKKSTAFKASAAAASALTGVCYLVFYEVMGRNAHLPALMTGFFTKSPSDGEPKKESARAVENAKWLSEQNFEEYVLVSDTGKNLKGYLLKADKPSKKFLFSSHGYRSCGKGECRHYAKYYHDKGFNVFMVDHQAAGESEGDYIGFGYHEYKDCLKWLSFLIENYGDDIEIVLHGVSMGSATVMMMTGAPDLPSNVKFTVADCGYTTAQNEFEHAIAMLGKIKYPIIYGAEFFNKLFNGYAFSDADALSAVKRAKIPMLFVHGDKDDFVPTKMVYELFDACSSEYKDLVIVKGAAHAESYRTDPDSIDAKLEEFFEKFLSE